MASFPGGINTFVPNWPASGKLQIEFSRNPKSFALNEYVGLRSVTKEFGYYLNIKAEEAARVVQLSDYVWPDGSAGRSPGGITNDTKEQFEWLTYVANRYKYDYSIGDLAAGQGDFDVVALHGRIMAQKAMTARTVDTLNTLTNSSSWGNNTDTATNLGGGQWSSSSATNQYILKTFMAVQQAISKSTLGVVKPKDLRVVMSPDLVKTIRTNAEIINFIQQQASAVGILTGEGADFFNKWGLPQYLYGVRVVVEDAIRVTTRKNPNSAASPGFAIANSVAIFVAMTQDVGSDTIRKPEPGDGVPIFDTCSLFVKEDMTVETRDNRDDRRMDCRIVDHFGSVLTAPASGFYVTGCQ